MELPWFKLYASNELAETIYLKNGEAGLYFKLMCKYWCDNHCGFDQETIDRLCVTNEDIHNMDYVLEKFFILIDKRYHHKGLLEQIAKQKENSAAQKNIKLKVTSKSPEGNLKVKKSQPLSSSSSSSSYTCSSKLFNKFWDNCAYKKSKGQAIKNYSKLDKEWSEQPEKLSELYNNYYNALEDKNFASYPSSWLSNLSFLDESKVVNINSPDEIKKTEEILEKSRYTRCVQAGKLIGITQSKFDELKIKYG
tara:strand:+ start:187 stop:939 length:753 start_codon:yes stop_codon:yes gene_type:complete